MTHFHVFVRGNGKYEWKMLLEWGSVKGTRLKGFRNGTFKP